MMRVMRPPPSEIRTTLTLGCDVREFMIYLTMMSEPQLYSDKESIMIWKEYRRKLPWPNFRYYSGICLE
jgi:hypothetical protein